MCLFDYQMRIKLLCEINKIIKKQTIFRLLFFVILP